MVLFGAIGYVLRKLDFPLAPVMLTFILGPMMERALRASLQLSQGDFSIMWGSPIAKVLLAMAALMLLSSGLKLVARPASGDAPPRELRGGRSSSEINTEEATTWELFGFRGWLRSS